MARTTLLTLAVAVLAFTGAAHASMLCDWTAPSVTHLTDSLDASDRSFDITDLYLYQVGGVDYYRIDLAAPASGAVMYGLVWDNAAGGVTGVSVPAEIVGADSFLYDQGGAGGLYTGGAFYGATLDVVENGGAMIQWAVASGLQLPAGGRAAVYSTDTRTWYDFTDPLAETPEPTPLALLGVGIAVLGLCYRRRGHGQDDQRGA